MLAARKTRNLRGSFRPRLPWTEKRSERFRNYRPERSIAKCSRSGLRRGKAPQNLRSAKAVRLARGAGWDANAVGAGSETGHSRVIATVVRA